MNKEAKIFGELLGLGISLILLMYVGPILPFLTEDYALWLSFAIAATVVSFLLNIVKHLIKKPFFFGLEALSLVPSFFSTYLLLQIFPLDFSRIGIPVLTEVARIALYFALFAMVIAFIVHCVKLITFSPVKS